MVTRFYYGTGVEPPVLPAYDAGWQSTAEAVRRIAALGKAAATETLSGSLGGAAGDNDLVCQIVSPPLNGDQTIAGSWTHVLRARELAGTDNIRARRWALKVVHNDGQTVRGTLRAYGASGTVTEYGTALSGILMANLGSLTSVNALDGDRIVIETGIGSDVTGTTPQWEAVLGGNGTDHAATNGDTTGTVGWVELSQTLNFKADTVTLSPAIMALSAVALDPDPQPVTIDLTPATFSFAAVTLDPDPQPVTVALTPAILTLTAVEVTPESAGAAVTLTPAALTLSSVAVTPVPQPVTITLTPAALPLSAVAVTPVPQPVTVPLTPATVTLTAVPLSSAPIGAGAVTLTPATISLTGVAVTPAPQPVTVAFTPSLLTLAPVALTATPGQVTTALTPAPLSLTAVALTPAATSSVTLSPALMALAAVALSPAMIPLYTPAFVSVDGSSSGTTLDGSTVTASTGLGGTTTAAGAF